MDYARFVVLGNPTNLAIVSLLAEAPLTNTELFVKLERNSFIKNRESVFKALKKLHGSKLVKRAYIDGVGFKYSLDFKEVPLSSKMKLVVK